jgi:hypothetical protein
MVDLNNYCEGSVNAGTRTPTNPCALYKTKQHIIYTPTFCFRCQKPYKRNRYMPVVLALKNAIGEVTFQEWLEYCTSKVVQHVMTPGIARIPANSNSRIEASHLCGNNNCEDPTHITLEDHCRNTVRNGCTTEGCTDLYHSVSPAVRCLVHLREGPAERATKGADLAIETAGLMDKCLKCGQKITTSTGCWHVTGLNSRYVRAHV